MKTGLVKRILAMGMMVMLLANEFIPALANSVSDEENMMMETVSATEEQEEASEQNVNPEVVESIASNETDSIEVEVVAGENTEVIIDDTTEENEIVESEETSEAAESVEDIETVTEEETQSVEETQAEISEETSEEETETEETEEVEAETEETEEEVETETEEKTEEEVETEEETETEETETEEETEEETFEDIVLEKEVNGVVITLTAPYGTLPEGAELWAEEITQTAANKEQLEVIDEALEAEAQQQAIEVQKYKAFDIKILVDGEAVQPEGDVKVAFTGDILVPQKEEESVAVYHVTEDAVANDVSTTVTDEVVEMETDHFSVYVIVVSEEADLDGYQVKASHYLSEDEGKAVADRQKFYKTTEYQLDKASKMTVPVQGGEDFTLDKVILKDSQGNVIETLTNDAASNNQVAIEISQDTEVELFYSPTSNANHRNEVTYFDYSVMSSGTKIVEDNIPIWWGIKASFEYNGTTYTNVEYRGGGKFYSGETCVITVSDGMVLNNMTVVSGGTTYEAEEVNVVTEYGSPAFKYMAEKAYTSAYKSGINSYGVGREDEFLGMGQTRTFHDYTLMINKNGTELNANVNNAVGGTNVEKAIIPNLIVGLTGDYSDVITGPGVYEPGYFNAKPLEGKTIYADRFELKFNREGHKYVLTSSVDKVAGKETLAGISNADFFPLNDVEYEDTQAAVEAAGTKSESLTKGNAFFGMRYDFTFSVGDYEGPLEYTFAGDDDMWVFLDGHRVMDLGGLHQAYPTAYGSPQESNTINLWEAVDANGNLLINPEDGTTKHQITVLYMERGAWDSTCYMEFIVPNAQEVQSVITERPNGNVEFVKVDSETGAALPGATFGLYKEGQNVALTTAVSGADGKVSFVNIKPGKYYVKEISAPEGYELNTTEYAVVVESGKTVTVNGGQIQNTIIKIEPIDIEFLKIYRYDHNLVLAGAEFSLKENDVNGKVLATAISGADGKFAFTGLEAGTYFMEETKAPEGYKLPAAGSGLTINVYEENKELKYTISSNNNGELFYMESYGDNLIKNVKTTDVTITKVWEDSKGEILTEAPVDEITVELRKRWYDESQSIWKDDSLVQTVTLKKDAAWTETIEKLDYCCDGGVWDYYIVETEVEGFEATYEALVDTSVEGAYNVSLTVTNKEEEKFGSLTITKNVDKVNLVHGEATFNFKIECPDGSVLYRTITFDTEVTNGASKSVTISNLPVGTYKVTELDTLRYECVSAVEQSDDVTAEEAATYEYTNKKDFNNYNSHADVKVNVVTFERDEDGNIIGSTISQQTTSSDN